MKAPQSFKNWNKFLKTKHKSLWRISFIQIFAYFSAWYHADSQKFHSFQNLHSQACDGHREILLTLCRATGNNSQNDSKRPYLELIIILNFHLFLWSKTHLRENEKIVSQNYSHMRTDQNWPNVNQGHIYLKGFYFFCTTSGGQIFDHVQERLWRLANESSD